MMAILPSPSPPPWGYIVLRPLLRLVDLRGKTQVETSVVDTPAPPEWRRASGLAKETTVSS